MDEQRFGETTTSPERRGPRHHREKSSSNKPSDALAAFNKAVLAVPEIEQCHMTAAGFDYLLKVRTRDISSYRKVLGERISAREGAAVTEPQAGLHVRA